MAVSNEYSDIEKVIVSSGKNVPDHHIDDYKDGNFSTFHKEDEKWNKEQLISQQEEFFNLLRFHDAEVLYANKIDGSPFQIFTRDIGFVVGNTFFYNLNRTLEPRKKEYGAIQHFLRECPDIEVKLIPCGKLEGGDVLIDNNELLIGISDRTTEDAIEFVEQSFPVRRVYLGPNVMHLDTRMALLPNEYMLIYRGAFQPSDLKYLDSKYESIPVTETEANTFGTNIFSINPELVVLHSGHKRIKNELQQRGFKTHSINYSEPHVLLGSFHCTTLPISRKK